MAGPDCAICNFSFVGLMGDAQGQQALLIRPSIRAESIGEFCTSSDSYSNHPSEATARVDSIRFIGTAEAMPFQNNGSCKYSLDFLEWDEGMPRWRVCFRCGWSKYEAVRRRLHCP